MKNLASMIALVSAAGLLLAGCSQSPAPGSNSSDGDAHTEVVYSASTTGGDLQSVEYTYYDATAGAMGQIENPAGSEWSTTADVFHDREVTVVPAAGATAHCEIRETKSDKVLVSADGSAAGESVTCDASVAPG